MTSDLVDPSERTMGTWRLSSLRVKQNCKTPGAFIKPTTYLQGNQWNRVSSIPAALLSSLSSTSSSVSLKVRAAAMQLIVLAYSIFGPQVIEVYHVTVLKYLVLWRRGFSLDVSNSTFHKHQIISYSEFLMNCCLIRKPGWKSIIRLIRRPTSCSVSCSWITKDGDAN